MIRKLIILGFISGLLSCNEQTVRKDDYSVHGIDVSHYQRNVDWKAVASQDIHFAFIKASEGEHYQDSLFCKNWPAVKKAGIRRGAYHFFRPSVPVQLQVNNFLTIADLQHNDLAPVLDIEVTDGVSNEQLLASVHSWLQLVEQHFKVKPIIYTNQKFFNKYLSGHLNGYPIWIARYNPWFDPCLSNDADWSFWQYGNKGRLLGIDNEVDFNVFKGTYEELDQYSLNRPDPLFIPNEDDVAMTAP